MSLKTRGPRYFLNTCTNSVLLRVALNWSSGSSGSWAEGRIRRGAGWGSAGGFRGALFSADLRFGGRGIGEGFLERLVLDDVALGEQGVEAGQNILAGEIFSAAAPLIAGEGNHQAQDDDQRGDGGEHLDESEREFSICDFQFAIGKGEKF